jgi:hypothetical protein
LTYARWSAIVHRFKMADIESGRNIVDLQHVFCTFNDWLLLYVCLSIGQTSLRSAILNTRLYLHIILYIWIFPRYLLFYSIFDKMPIDKHIYNNNQSLNVQNTCCKSTIFLPDSISAILNLWTIADHLVCILNDVFLWYCVFFFIYISYNFQQNK